MTEVACKKLKALLDYLDDKRANTTELTDDMKDAHTAMNAEFEADIPAAGQDFKVITIDFEEKP